MPCKECGCTKATCQPLAEEVNHLTLSENREPESSLSAKAPTKSCCSSCSNSSCCRSSRPNQELLQCGCTKAADQTLAEKTNNLDISEKRKPECNCSAKGGVKSYCSSTSNSTSGPNRGGSCCCRSCCACCRCCSRSSRDFCQDRINEATAGGCSYCGSKEEDVKQATCGCKH